MKKEYWINVKHVDNRLVFFKRVKFCHRIEINYVSCSPFRMPIAKLAAAQAALEFPRKNN